MIDEYDNFANTVLAHHGEEAYESLTHGGGFYRNFFATLKAAADEGAVAARLGEAWGQLRGYLADEALTRRQPSVHYVGLAIVFHGLEMAACEAVDSG